MTIKGYITNLGKYNEGFLVGEWIEFPIGNDDLQEVLKEIGCSYYNENDEYIQTGYEEFFFTDWDCEFDHSFGEYESIANVNEIAEKLKNWDEDTFAAACEVWGMTEILEHDADDYILCRNIGTDDDLGYYWIHETGCYDLKNMGALVNYIDYEAFGRDIRFEINGGHTSYGWVEYVG